ncbi:hypothetical protein GGR51DRAFT_526242 [Nemania sp. FL0031]|nr:hypothetical protein GGR51DRAFT_526242 [Nemania sp. FL0031]
MCNVDVTINTLFWESPGKVQGTRAGSRRCINWDRLEAWAEDRILISSDRETFLRTLVVPFGAAGSVGPVDLLI